MLFEEHLVRSTRSAEQAEIDRALIHAAALDRRRSARRRRLVPHGALRRLAALRLGPEATPAKIDATAH